MDHPSIVQEFAHNVLHNLFKPLLLFFYMGFLIPILRVPFEFPKVIYQGITIYLLISIGWHGGEELAKLTTHEFLQAGGFMVIGFITNACIGYLAYLFLRAMTRLRRVDAATIGAYYGSDSAGTFATCMGVLGVLYVVLFLPGVVKALSDFVDITVMSKAGSSSGVERMGWNAQGMTNFFDTYGIGVGLGSILASSFLVVLLGSLGVVGTFCYAMFVGKSLLSPVSADYPFTERAVC